MFKKTEESSQKNEFVQKLKNLVQIWVYSETEKSSPKWFYSEIEESSPNWVGSELKNLVQKSSLMRNWKI